MLSFLPSFISQREYTLHSICQHHSSPWAPAECLITEMRSGLGRCSSRVTFALRTAATDRLLSLVGDSLASLKAPSLWLGALFSATSRRIVSLQGFPNSTGWQIRKTSGNQGQRTRWTLQLTCPNRSSACQLECLSALKLVFKFIYLLARMKSVMPGTRFFLLWCSCGLQSSTPDTYYDMKMNTYILWLSR